MGKSQGVGGAYLTSNSIYILIREIAFTTGGVGVIHPLIEPGYRFDSELPLA